jgi:hypothetical protein
VTQAELLFQLLDGWTALLLVALTLHQLPAPYQPFKNTFHGNGNGSVTVLAFILKIGSTAKFIQVSS